MLSSWLAEARVFPSGLKATATTALVCPVSVSSVFCSCCWQDNDERLRSTRDKPTKMPDSWLTPLV